MNSLVKKADEMRIQRAIERKKQQIAELEKQINVIKAQKNTMQRRVNRGFISVNGYKFFHAVLTEYDQKTVDIEETSEVIKVFSTGQFLCEIACNPSFDTGAFR